MGLFFLDGYWIQSRERQCIWPLSLGNEGMALFWLARRLLNPRKSVVNLATKEPTKFESDFGGKGDFSFPI